MSDSSEHKLRFTLKELKISTEGEDVSPGSGSSSAVKLHYNKLVCIEYPALIANVDKMLETIGGEKVLSKTYADPNRRLELRYRPKDPFCHSLCGNRFPSNNLLLRVRRRVRKKDPQDTQLHMEVLGVIGTTYKFQGMADFQCLALHSEDGKHTSLYDKVILRTFENQEFFEQPMPFFLPPPIFSRLDTPVDYNYRPDIHHNQLPMTKENFIGLNRVRRHHNAIFVSFADATVPSECMEAARLNWQRVCIKQSDVTTEQTLRKMFESRPIWSRNAVKGNLDIHPEKLKLLLPVMAYYMVTGPWRSLWVRLGYDPRKSPESKKYQMLDFRIRCSTRHGYSLSDMPVKAKRSSMDYSLSITLNKMAPQAASVTELPQEGPSTSRYPIPVRHQLKESSYVFRDGMLPPHRQMFYQLCDLDVESIKEVIGRNKGDEKVCDERDGWCLPHTTDDLRDIISGLIKKVVRAQKPNPPAELIPTPTKRRRSGLSMASKRTACAGKPEGEEDNEEDEEADEEDDFHPSEGSENEMETEMLDYM
ncbi:general transcription factor 3C polypeptide 5 isoform X1 [Gadus macrocephalus]|uniref:general transcription factor 3C polypeptide 5 isoform X1 n=1 Tax=Gadus macrocephalus TaxID=80720 RepID=UPI0028CB6762|nr:general transcription factor 3C polypeptide 5 isoform X1 [Gadus macrocephalus]